MSDAASAATSDDRRPVRVPRPSLPPDRAALLAETLAITGRNGVPIRTRFVQRSVTEASKDRGSMLSTLVKGRSANALDAFLLIHAVASAHAPYGAWVAVTNWVRLMELDQRTGTGVGADGKKAARTQWSKLATKLVELRLIRRGHGLHKVGYTLLDESGSGEEYVRPVDHNEHGTWFTVPHMYWLSGFDRTLSLAAKAMLLVALSSKPRFRLPPERVPEWYGFSESTARRGLKELIDAGILEYDQAWRPSASSPTGWAEVRTYYLLNDWSYEARSAAMKSDRNSHPGVRFDSEGLADAASAPITESVYATSVERTSVGAPAVPTEDPLT